MRISGYPRFGRRLATDDDRSTQLGEAHETLFTTSDHAEVHYRCPVFQREVECEHADRSREHLGATTFACRKTAKRNDQSWMQPIVFQYSTDCGRSKESQVLCRKFKASLHKGRKDAVFDT